MFLEPAPRGRRPDAYGRLRLTPKEQIIRLVRLQELATAIRESRRVVEESPLRVEEIEARFRERNAEYVALKERHDELEAEQRRRSGELETLEESRKKYMADLMQVKNQREYSAILKEIDGIKAQIGDHETAILKAMDELETLESDLQTHTEHIDREREAVEKERSEVQVAVREAEERIERFGRERAAIEGELPRPLVGTVRRLEDGRAGLFLVEAVDGTCQACFVRVRPQAYQEIRLASRIHTCSNCKRILYYAPTLTESSPEQSGGPAEQPGLGG